MNLEVIIFLPYTEHWLKAIETRHYDDQICDGSERQLQKLESTIENTSEDLTELSRKVTSSEYAIESLEYDLRRDIDNKIIDHAQRLTRAESDIEYLRLQVAELNSGITKKIDDVFKMFASPFRTLTGTG